jgi:hypothetical protein
MPSIAVFGAGGAAAAASQSLATCTVTTAAPAAILLAVAVFGINHFWSSSGLQVQAMARDHTD